MPRGHVSAARIKKMVTLGRQYRSQMWFMQVNEAMLQPPCNYVQMHTLEVWRSSVLKVKTGSEKATYPFCAACKMPLKSVPPWIAFSEGWWTPLQVWRRPKHMNFAFCRSTLLNCYSNIWLYPITQYYILSLCCALRWMRAITSWKGSKYLLISA